VHLGEWIPEGDSNWAGSHAAGWPEPVSELRSPGYRTRAGTVIAFAAVGQGAVGEHYGPDCGHPQRAITAAKGYMFTADPVGAQLSLP
jgi:hypothetical protein